MEITVNLSEHILKDGLPAQYNLERRKENSTVFGLV